MNEPILTDPPRHHLQKGKDRRVRLSGGPFVDTTTLRQLDAWHACGPSYGEIIDRLTHFASRRGFNPVTAVS